MAMIYLHVASESHEGEKEVKRCIPRRPLWGRAVSVSQQGIAWSQMWRTQQVTMAPPDLALGAHKDHYDIRVERQPPGRRDGTRGLVGLLDKRT